MDSWAAMSLDGLRMEQELAAQAAWVRALARSLVRDPATADDVAQDAWVAALRSPPRESGEMRNWLAGVVKKLAWKNERKAQRARGAGDGALGAQESVEHDSLVELEKLELHGMLVEELRALREPLRTTLLQRYVSGLSSAEIAAKAGLPAATVRWRLQQGLEELRARLDTRFGGKRNEWMSALAFALPSKGAVVAGSGTALGGSGVAIGKGVLMSTLMKCTIGAAVLVAAVMLALPFVSRDEPARAALPKSADAPLAQPEGEPRPELAGALDSQGDSRAAVATAGASPAASTPAGDTRVVARVLDEQLRPIAGAWLRFSEYQHEFLVIQPENEARSGAEGVVTLHWKGALPKFSGRFALGADGFEAAFQSGDLKQGEALDLGDVKLRSGGIIRGRVVDREQRPVAGAAVVTAVDRDSYGVKDLELMRNSGPARGGPQQACLSALDGRFVLEGVPAGTTRAWARLSDLRWSVSSPIDVPAGGVVDDIVLVIEPEPIADPDLADIDGIVLDPDGKPIAKPRLQIEQEGPQSSASNGNSGGEDGRFRIHPNERGLTFAIEASDPGDRFMRARVADLKPGAKGVEIRLAQAPTLELVVTDTSGPVEHYRVHWGKQERAESRFLDKDEVHVGGRVSLRVLSDACWFYVESPGHRSAKLGPIDGRAPPAVLPAVLETLPGVHGRVLDGEQPVAGAKVTICAQRTSASLSGDGFQSTVETHNAVSTRSGADGSFSLDVQKDGEFSIFADADGFARGQYGPIAISPAKGLSGVVLQLDAGGTLEGKVLMPPGRSPVGVVVGINRGDGKPQRRTVAADGAYRFEHLTAGPWELLKAPDPSAGMSFGGGQTTSVHLRDDFTIVVGQTTHKDLDLSDTLPCVVDFDLKNNAAPARAWTILVTPKGNYQLNGVLPSVATDANGHAHAEIEFAGECTLTITPAAETSSDFQFHADITLQRGANSWSQDIKTGRVEGAIRGWKAEAGTTWFIGSDASTYPHELHPDASGRFTLPLVAVGKVTVQRTQDNPQLLAGRETVQTFELLAGQTKTIQLP